MPSNLQQQNNTCLTVTTLLEQRDFHWFFQHNTGRETGVSPLSKEEVSLSQASDNELYPEMSYFRIAYISLYSYYSQRNCFLSK